MSMLRNVLTYMGLGPDEDYDDGYLSDPRDRRAADDQGADGGSEGSDEERADGRGNDRLEGPAGKTVVGHQDEIDLTDGPPAARRSSGQSASAKRTNPATRTNRTTRTRRESPDRSAGADPHAQRDRPDWLRRSSGEDDDGSSRGGRDHARRGAHDASRSLEAVEAAETIAERRNDRESADVVPNDPANDDGVTVRPTEPTSRPTSSSPPAGGRSDEVHYVTPVPLAPLSFGDAKVLADEFKADVPVVMDLQGVDRELARRLIDFASGICYALDGSMEKLDRQVFLLTPVRVEVSDADRARLSSQD